MNFHVRFAVTILGACLAGVAVAAVDPIERVDEVRDITPTTTAKSTPQKNASANRHHGDFWNLKENQSEFGFLRLGGPRYRIDRVTMDIDQEIEDPVFLRLNPHKPWLAPETDTGRKLSDFQFLLALHEMEEGHSGAKSWHALIYVPVTKSSGDEFYLVVRSIEKNLVDCNKWTDAAEKLACQKLHALSVMKIGNASTRDLATTIVNTIDEILPLDGTASAKANKVTNFFYHNGVIHGSLF
jgi:hypothetical protein